MRAGCPAVSLSVNVPRPIMALILPLLSLLRALLLTRRQLVLENAALRQQLNVLRRQVPRPRLGTGDRVFWLVLRRIFPEWRSVLAIASPKTVLRWHRGGFRLLWRWKSRHKLGRPAIPRKLLCLIWRLQRENPTWGAHRIANELALLGHKVGKSTVGRYMRRKFPTGRGQSWKTFVQNHMNVTAACDFFVVPTLGFRRLFAFVVLSHDRRRIRHIAVTARPSVAWTAAQIRTAFSEPGARPTYLIHDREKTFRCPGFLQALQQLAITDKKTARRQPWMNGYCERVIGTLRRECTDHLIALNERHLERLLRTYAAYYNASRTHMALERNAPLPRAPARAPAGELLATPVLGGLHHTYAAAA
jgi:putative transposase